MKTNEGKPEQSDQSRRAFLRTSITGGLAVAALLPWGGATKEHPPLPIPLSELDEISLADLRKGLRSGTSTSRSVTERYLKHIDELDAHGPSLRSIIELNPDALAIAGALDAERSAKGERGPLHGIPIVIKDNIATADRMATTAGSLALVGSRPPRDSFVVRQLRAAGAVILGKTNLSEWANIRSSHSTSGWSGRGGLTKNPYALDRNTSGSSSGSAVAVTSSLCAAGVGTETDGSIVSPSSINGIVGIKPTVGLVSRTGIVPISHTQDTAGPMARTVQDAAILLGALAGIDREDAATTQRARKAAPDYTAFLDARGLQGARIGVLRTYFGFHEGVDRLMEEAIAALKREGAVIVDPVEMKSLAKLGNAEELVLHYELKADLNAYLAGLGPDAPVHTLKEVIAFNEKNRSTEMAYFGQDTFLKAEACGPLTEKEYRDAVARCKRLTQKEGIDAEMQKHTLDALIAPTDSAAWVTDLVDGDHYLGGSSTVAAVAGYPSITVPAGFICGLPVGISFFGRAWSEGTLIKLAYAFEQATKHRRPPKFLATAEVG